MKRSHFWPRFWTASSGYISTYPGIKLRPNQLKNKKQMRLSEKRGSNPQPSAWKADTLPLELFSQLFVGMTGLEPATSCSQSTHTTNCTTSRYNLLELNPGLYVYPDATVAEFYRIILGLTYLPIPLRLKYLSALICYKSFLVILA